MKKFDVTLKFALHKHVGHVRDKKTGIVLCKHALKRIVGKFYEKDGPLYVRISSTKPTDDKEVQFHPVRIQSKYKCYTWDRSPSWWVTRYSGGQKCAIHGELLDRAESFFRNKCGKNKDIHTIWVGAWQYIDED